MTQPGGDRRAPARCESGIRPCAFFIGASSRGLVTLGLGGGLHDGRFVRFPGDPGAGLSRPVYLARGKNGRYPERNPAGAALIVAPLAPLCDAALNAGAPWASPFLVS